MNAAKLRRRHLPILEWRALERFPQAAQHECAVELLLLRKACDIDRFEARERLASVFEIRGNRLAGEIAQPVVVPVVPNVGGQFRLSAQRVFPLIVQQTIQFRPPVFQGLPASLGEERDELSHGETDNHKRCAHDRVLRNLLFYTSAHK